MEKESAILKELRAGRFVILNTKGTSMRPLLWQGRTQVLARPRQRPLRLGDLPVVLVGAGCYRIHRVVALDQQSICTRGDNCVGTESVMPDAVVGIVTDIFYGRRRVSVAGPGYRLYSWLWMHTAGIRIPIYRLRARILHLGSRIRNYAGRKNEIKTE